MKKKNLAQILKIGRVITIVVRLTKIQKQVKNQEKAFSSIFE